MFSKQEVISKPHERSIAMNMLQRSSVILSENIRSHCWSHRLGISLPPLKGPPPLGFTIQLTFDHNSSRNFISKGWSSGRFVSLALEGELDIESIIGAWRIASMDMVIRPFSAATVFAIQLMS